MTYFPQIQEREKFLLSSSSEDFKKQLPFFSFSEISHSLLTLKQYSNQLSPKIKILLDFLHSPQQLKKLSEVLNEVSFSHFLDLLIIHSSPYPLSSLFIYLPPQVFFNHLCHLSKDQLELIKKESLFEPLQYLLTLFIHTQEKERAQIQDAIQNLYILFNPNQTHLVSHLNFKECEKQIIDVQEKAQNLFRTIQVGLELIWQTERIDLIEKMSQLNENVHHDLMFLIGHSASQQTYASGLYESLENCFFKVFKEPFLLDDQDTALEGLARLSIWQIQDYQDIGLLPISSEKKVSDFNPELFMIEDQQTMLNQIQDQLNHLNLKTVKDLKKMHIFSKSDLIDYIQKFSAFSTM